MEKIFASKHDIIILLSSYYRLHNVLPGIWHHAKPLHQKIVFNPVGKDKNAKISWDEF